MIRIPDHIKKQIYIHGESAYPEECCGIFLGTERDGIRTIHEAIAIHNAQELNRDRRFFITPEHYRNAEKVARDKNLELIGVYHSHPDHMAAPSQFDTEHALPWFVYLIVSVYKRQSDRITAWVLSENRQLFEEQHVQIE